MKKLFCFVLLFLLPTICFAYDNKLNIVVEKEEKIILKIDSKEEKIYGLSAKLIYDKNYLEFNKCDSNNNYDVTVQNDIIVIDNVRAFNNSNIVTCYFNVKNETNATLKLEDVIVSNEKKIQSYFKNEKYEENVDNPKTSTQNIILILLFIFVIILVLLYSKKKIKILNVLLVFLLPINIFAFSYDNKYTFVMVNEIKSIILGEKNIDIKYDIYDDNKVDINDLIIYKILASRPNVEVETLFGSKGKKYYSSVSYKFTKDKITNLEKLSYCVTTEDKCDDFKDNLDLNGDIEIALTSNEEAQRMCVYLKNNLGLESTYCDDESYFVDTEKPTFDFKEQIVKVGADGDDYIKTKNVINSKFGISGGNVSCLSINKFVIGDNEVTCTAEANNGLKEVKKYIINKSNTLNARAIFFGDSITDGWNNIEGNLDSWADLIGKNYDLKEYLNCGSGGATISDFGNNTIIKVINGKYSTGKCTLSKYNDFNKNSVDYVILSGGINDINLGNLPNGTFNANDYNGVYDANTNAGSIENYIYLITTKYKGARIGYILTTYTPNYTERYNEQQQKEYFTLLKNILNKWKIPYFELNSIPELQNGANLTYISDTVHPNKAGYNLITPKIYNWMQTIPVYSR